MRIWSIHPRQLDRQALIACWRETLLAQKVLEGKTKGYKNHPQLRRFKESPEPLALIGIYLTGLVAEAKRRGYNFDATKILRPPRPVDTGETAKGRHEEVGDALAAQLPVTRGQLEYEWQHLLKKIQQRNPQLYPQVRAQQPQAHPLFEVVSGEIEDWEVTDPIG